jgi:hypothetical protein
MWDTASMGFKTAYKLLVGKSEVQRPLETEKYKP